MKPAAIQTHTKTKESKSDDQAIPLQEKHLISTKRCRSIKAPTKHTVTTDYLTCVLTTNQALTRGELVID